jgi:glycosyltransferase involved in cell wall biosynthesis
VAPFAAESLVKQVFKKLSHLPHVVIACGSCGKPGSVAAVALRQTQELSKYFEVTLISDSFPDRFQSESSLVVVRPRQFDFLRRFGHVPNAYAFVHSVRNALRKIHEKRPIDFMICHSHPLATLAALRLKNQYGIPFALVTHGDIFERPPGTYDSRLTAFYRSVTPAAYKSADLVIALSPYMAQWAIRGGAKSECVSIIPNGIDDNDVGLQKPKFIRTDSSESQQLKIVFVGNFTKPKGLEVLIAACGVLRHRNIPYHLTVVGSGPLENDIRNQIAGSRLLESITLVGHKPRTSLADIFGNADICCIPSLSDPLPTVALESLICGTPVIGANTGGIPFMVNDGYNGLLFPPGNSTVLADCIQQLVIDRMKLLQLATNARHSVWPKFSWQNIGKELSEEIHSRIRQRTSIAS